MSKLHDIIRKLSADGWGVTDCGYLVKPDLTIRETRVKFGKGSRPDYLTFNVKHDGSSYPVPVHKLVAYQKFGEASFEDSIVVRHLDGLSLNNETDNIPIGRHSDNMMDRPTHERIEHSLRSAVHIRKLSDQEVWMVRNSGRSTGELAQDLNVAYNTIAYIRRGLTYRNV